MKLILLLPEILQTLDPDSKEFQLALVAAYEKVANATEHDRASPEWEAQAMENYRAISERFLHDPDALVRLVGPCKAVAVFAPTIDFGLKTGPKAKARDLVVEHGRHCSCCQEMVLAEIAHQEEVSQNASRPRPA